MARAKEVQVLVFDVNPTMGPNLRLAKDAMLMHVQQKMIQTPKTEIGLLCVGTEVTYNELQDDGYDNVFVKRGIEQVSVDLLKDIEQVDKGVDLGDYLDALVVAADMIHKHCEKKAFEKTVVFVTNFQMTQRQADAVDDIAAALRSQDIQLTIHGFGLTRDDTKDPPDGEKVLRELARGLDKTEVVAVDDAADLKSAMVTRSVKPTTTFRGYFEVTPSLKIKVWSYPATKPAAFPTLKKRRKVADGDGDAGGGISNNRQYVLQDDNDVEIPPEQLIKAFKYGSDQVPVADADAANMKVKAEKGMWLLAFAPRSKVKPHYLMSNAEVVVADCKDPEPSTSMLAALVVAMRDVTDKDKRQVEHVAVVRWVRRQNDPPRLYALFAHHDPLTATYCLYACKLPFNEDLRRSPFTSLRGNAALQPSPDQLKAARSFVAALDMTKHSKAAGAVKEEDGSEAAIVVSSALDAVLVFNPVVQHFYRCLNHKALYGDAADSSSSSTPAPPPPAKEDLAKCLNPDPALWKPAMAAVESLRDELKIPVLEDKKRKLPDDDALLLAGTATTTPGGDDAGKADDGGGESKKARTDDALGFSFAAAHTKDGAFDTTNPEGHFEALWKLGDLDAHENAIREMTKHVIDIVDNSPGERFYAKAISCLRKLRTFCDAARNDEPDLFNHSFDELRDKYQSRSDIAFWTFLLKQAVERIKTSDVEEEPAPPKPAAPAPVAAPDDDDDLLDEAD